MAIGCGAKCAKYLLFAFNIIFWLTGIGLIVLGAICAVDSKITHSVRILADYDYIISTFAYALIILGCIVFVVGFCGCCGAIRESQCLLGTYIFFLVVIMAAEIAVGILFAINKNKIIGLDKTGLTKRLQEMYPPENSKDFDKNAFLASVKFNQLEYKCCGINGKSDYQTSYWYNNFTAEQIRMYRIEAPPSCCGIKDVDRAATAEAKKCADDGSFYKDGCYEASKKAIQSKLPIYIGVVCGIAALEIFGVIFAICLCCNVGQEERYS